MKKLIHVKKHLRKGRVVKAHSRKSTRLKKRNLAMLVGTEGKVDKAPKASPKDRRRGKGGRVFLSDSAKAIQEGRNKMNIAVGRDRLSEKSKGSILARYRIRQEEKAEQKKQDTYKRLISGPRGKGKR